MRKQGETGFGRSAGQARTDEPKDKDNDEDTDGADGPSEGGRAVNTWYAIVWHGSFGRYRQPPTGPWPSLEHARQAAAAWRDRIGADQGATPAHTTVRIVGPYRTRAEARNADISDEHVGHLPAS